ncbi:hypothetical protein [Calothrix sp. 336/3]|uniref:hypothetical protein n=1 Tax=Calothrix sp. 336/3 TaxID=1337936 RepID=UPI0004E3E9C6|nr:hypothetical protein [Calothrix sp. 336/3]AKG22152.1 hypothetical protein IJ00_13560 [Calothrix sp. 336/3]
MGINSPASLKMVSIYGGNLDTAVTFTESPSFTATPVAKHMGNRSKTPSSLQRVLKNPSPLPQFILCSSIVFFLIFVAGIWIGKIEETSQVQGTFIQTETLTPVLSTIANSQISSSQDILDRDEVVKPGRSITPQTSSEISLVFLAHIPQAKLGIVQKSNLVRLQFPSQANSPTISGRVISISPQKTHHLDGMYQVEIALPKSPLVQPENGETVVLAINHYRPIAEIFWETTTNSAKNKRD